MMVQSNGKNLLILIAGGGIGGLAAAWALARKGFPVRVFEQAPEFKELGAGIQLGPNIFRALDKLGLKDAVLASAHQPPAMQMRCALSGDLVTRIPLDDPRFLAHFHYPYAVTHRADIHAAILKSCQASNLVTLETQRTVESYEEDGDGVVLALQSGERVKGRALVAATACGRKSASASSATASRASPAISPTVPCLSATRCRKTYGARTWCCGRDRARISCTTRCAAASST